MVRAVISAAVVLLAACSDDTGPGGAGGTGGGGSPAQGGGGAATEGGAPPTGGQNATGGEGGAGGSLGTGGAGGAAPCDPSAFVGAGIASDEWGEGDFCDEVFVCAPSGSEEPLGALFPGVMCMPGGTCGDGMDHCTLSDGGTITAEEYESLCDALHVDGVTSIVCIVFE